MSFEMDVSAIKTLVEDTAAFVCDKCGREFNTKTGFTEHMTRKHSGKTYDTSTHREGCTCFVCKAKRGEMSGENNPFFGKAHSEETVSKMSAAKQGKTYDEIYGEGAGDDMRKRRSAESTGRYQSPEKGRKISAALKNKPLSAAHKQKLSDIWDVGHTAEVINKMGKISKSSYKRGEFTSHKNNSDIHFQSSYELYTYICLEHDDEVKSYSRCNFSIPYVFNGKARRHVADIDIRYKDGSRKILEIKPTRLMNDPEVMAKKLAGENIVRSTTCLMRCGLKKRSRPC